MHGGYISFTTDKLDGCRRRRRKRERHERIRRRKRRRNRRLNVMVQRHSAESLPRSLLRD